MTELREDSPVTEVVPARDLADVTPETPQRKPRGKASKAPKKKPTRDLEALWDAPVRSMTDVEKTILITALREHASDQAGSIKMLDRNAQQAYEKLRKVTDDAHKIKMEAHTKLSFARQAIETCRNSIMLMGGLEE